MEIIQCTPADSEMLAELNKQLIENERHDNVRGKEFWKSLGFKPGSISMRYSQNK